ncbi:uncharacterized protein MONOS_18273 [Monocercomonoides exilis]|uniref:uncharacterized protein n=1 Tax=Monocercomonoides exilis TaxID=2049356 RepID=UPI00355AB7F0|nr:hypothetical protein MONOS_18273 [Monocercomonoides exilis]
MRIVANFECLRDAKISPLDNENAYFEYIIPITTKILLKFHDYYCSGQLNCALFAINNGKQFQLFVSAYDLIFDQLEKNFEAVWNSYWISCHAYRVLCLVV